MIILDTSVLVDFSRFYWDTNESYGALMISRAELELGVRAAPKAVEAANRIRRLADLEICEATLRSLIPFDYALSA